MRTMLVLFILCSTALAGGDTPPSPWITENNGTVTWQQPRFLSIVCGQGMVNISMTDGSVKFEGDCTPDDAAKSFWTAIHAIYGIGCPQSGDKK